MLPVITIMPRRNGTAFNRGLDPSPAATLWQILAEPHRDLGLDPEPTIAADRQLGASVVHLVCEDRAKARLVDAAQFLHDRRRQPDLVAGDGARPAALSIAS
jgi:hypothetical protein